MILCKTKDVACEECMQRFYTISIPDGQDIHDQSKMYLKLLKQIADNQEKIVFEKVFSCLNKKTTIHTLLNITEKQHPSVFIEGAPIDKEYLAYLQIYTVKNTIVDYILYDNHPVATKYIVDGNTRLYIAGLYYNIRNEVLSDGFKYAISTIDKCLDEADMDYHNLVRAWFYLGQIYKNYSEFNILRKNLYEKKRIDYSATSNDLPASTCIEGYGEMTTAITTEFLCYDKKTVITKRIYNSKQNEADGEHYLYSPTFSRAQCLISPHYTELQISGTASVDINGKTVHLNDANKQIEHTLINVRKLLLNVKMDFENICIATCFFKNSEDFVLFDEIIKRMNIVDFPHVKVKANICRADLLFELDGIAIRN